MRNIVLIAHDIRSAHNVGALLRTADGFGATVILTGYTPFPTTPTDSRLPHLARKLTAQIHKTALGVEADHDVWSYQPDVHKAIGQLRVRKYEVVALEQAPGSIDLPAYQPADNIAILLGREVEGISSDLMQLCDKVVEIPRFGQKESLNVVEAATAALYHCRFHPF